MGGFRALCFLAVGLSIFCGTARADNLFRRIQHGFEFGPEIYQGVRGPNVIMPEVSGRFSFVSRYDFVDWVALVGKVTANGFYGIQGFANVTTSPFFGFSLGYSPCFRLKTGVEGVVPYVEVGGLAGVYFVSLTGMPPSTSPTETAVKLGYTATFGVDWFADSNHGLWGLGIGFTYFSVFAGPAFMDFRSAQVGFSGFRADVHIALSM